MSPPAHRRDCMGYVDGARYFSLSNAYRQHQATAPRGPHSPRDRKQAQKPASRVIHSVRARPLVRVLLTFEETEGCEQNAMRLEINDTDRLQQAPGACSQNSTRVNDGRKCSTLPATTVYARTLAGRGQNSLLVTPALSCVWGGGRKEAFYDRGSP